jgi:VCBS repeat-containing protein
VTVNRIDGTTAVSELTTGAMSTQNPPDGIRIRPGDYSLSLGGDYQAQYHADWRQSVGTLDQYRVPRLELTPAGNSAVSVERMLSIGVGMRVDITDLQSKDIYDDLQQLVTGRVLRLGERNYPRVSLVCAPYEVYQTFALTGDDRARPGMSDTETGSTLTDSQTGSLTIISATGYYLVTTAAADFPMDVMIDGERITLSGVVDTATPGQQTATITVRGVNGAAKAHAVGETIQLAEPNRYQFRD